MNIVPVPAADEDAAQAAEAAAMLSEDFANFSTPAEKHSITMSADAVAVEMDKLLASGQISPEEKSLILWFFSHCRENKLSLAEAGKLISFSATTIYRVWRGQYEGSLAKVIGAIRRFKQLLRERERLSNAEFIQTSVWDAVRATCDFAIVMRRPCRIVGPSQIGKTAALLEYQRRSEYLVRYCRIPAAPRFRSVVETIAEACGIAPGGSPDVLRKRVMKSLDSNSLLVVDELHELAISASKRTALDSIEWIREIFDRRQCGIVLCGTRSMEDDLFRGDQRGWLDQLDQRCVRIASLPDRLTEEDLYTIARAYHMPRPGDSDLEILRTLRMGRLTLTLQLVLDNADKLGQPPNWTLFKTLLRSVRGEAN